MIGEIMSEKFCSNTVCYKVLGGYSCTRAVGCIELPPYTCTGAIRCKVLGGYSCTRAIRCNILRSYTCTGVVPCNIWRPYTCTGVIPCKVLLPYIHFTPKARKNPCLHGCLCTIGKRVWCVSGGLHGCCFALFFVSDANLQKLPNIIRPIYPLVGLAGRLVGF